MLSDCSKSSGDRGTRTTSCCPRDRPGLQRGPAGAIWWLGSLLVRSWRADADLARAGTGRW